MTNLSLNKNIDFHHLHLTSPKCTRLELIGHGYPYDYMGGDCYFKIVAPYVQHLKILGDLNPAEIKLGELSSLIHADLTYEANNERDLKISENGGKEQRCDRLGLLGFSGLHLEKEERGGVGHFATGFLTKKKSSKGREWAWVIVSEYQEEVVDCFRGTFANSHYNKLNYVP
ncbi:hypothetical protein H5410_006050 [Solanum commersonii]|uniref:Uncharacterized protein n=1 Tax=Solanum commersonii TaxID=4109 RepID=A0A9J6A8T7_SOLCO|nr:hypothetical protein H5410_006050 [Solanum commersonii]